MTFTDLVYNVTVKLDRRERKEAGKKNFKRHILKGITGHVLPGESLFVMGASGCGKTSLLNILSDRIAAKRGSSIKGTIMVNDNQKLDMELFSRIGAYVMQDDILFQFFTPREALRFAARLKLKIPKKEQDEKVEKLLTDLGLLAAADT